MMVDVKKIVSWSGILLMLLFVTPVTGKEEKSRFEKLELFNKVLHLIETQYYREVDTEILIQGALKGMMSTLDPHSSFLDKEFFSKMQEDTQGEFGGLGIEVTQKEGIIYVITPIDDTPAFRAGLRSGDKIFEIDHTNVIGIDLEKAVDLMRGKAGSKVNIGIKREIDGKAKILHFDLAREVIKLRPVKSQLIDGQYAFLRLTQFQKNAATFLISALKKLKKEAEKQGGLAGIILDLRQNPGGLLEEAVDVASIFLQDGIVVSIEQRDPRNKELKYVKKGGDKELELPMIVLINGASASASEIVAGALQDHQRAVIMGGQSFGKGSVQSVAKIDEQTGVKMTIAQYMTPNGRKIQAIGIKPDVELDEFAAAWISENKKESYFIREKDLRNHLTSTIETPEEKQQRELAEQMERKAKLSSKKKKITEKADQEEGDQNMQEYNPQEDFQVISAVSYLKGLSVLLRKKAP